MKTIEIVGYGEGLNPDELELQAPCEHTCKLIDHLRHYKDWLGIQIYVSPMGENSRIMRDRDTFFLHQIGDKKKRDEIKQSINGFCERNNLSLPKWPDYF